jgi:hypothetical protein
MTCTGSTRDEMTGTRSDDWILLALFTSAPHNYLLSLLICAFTIHCYRSEPHCTSSHTTRASLPSRVLSTTAWRSQSKSHCDWQSVSLSVLVSYPIWGIWPEICFFIFILRKLQSCLCGRPLWREVGSVVCQPVLCPCQYIYIYIYIYNVFPKHNRNSA